MKRYILVIFIAACLLISISGPVIARMGGGSMGGGQMGERGRAFDMMNQGMGLRGGQGMHGLGFMHSGENAFGEYVTFTVDNRTGNVIDYGVAGIPLFDIGIADFSYDSTTEAGSITRISNTDGSILVQLHDNPAGIINIITNKNISVTFTLADGVNASKEDKLVKIESGSLVAYIAGTGIITTSVSSTAVVVEASGDSAMVFRASPVNMPMFDNMGQRFSQEIAGNRLGMEIAFGRNRTYNAINYSADMHVRVQAMEQDRIRMFVNSTDPTGRVISMNLDNSSLVIGARERLRIHYDGTPLQCVNDPNIVFNGTDRPLCWISQEQDRARAQVMIHVPDFSEHTIDIVVEPEEPVTQETPEPGGSAKSTPGFGAAVSVAGVLILAYRKRIRN
jgi:hypothetical protein